MAFDPSQLLQGLPIVGDVLGGIITNQGNKKQAEINRNFQAQQAQLARDWQEDMYNRYSSPSAMVQQYKDAGLNPALMFNNGQSVGQGFSTSSPSGAQATLTNPADNLLAKMQSIVQLKEMIANNQSQRELQSSEAHLNYSSADVNSSVIALNNTIQKLNNKEMDHLDAKIANLIKDTENKEQQRLLMIAQTAMHKANNEQISLKNAISDSFYEKTGIKADSDTINTIMNACFNLIGDIGGFLSNLVFKRGFRGVPKVQKSIPMPKLEVKSRFTP